MLAAMVDKTDASELAPETVAPDEVARARFAVLRDQLLTDAERLNIVGCSLEQLSVCAQLVSAAAHANQAVRLGAIEELEEKKQADLNNYLNQFGQWFKAIEDNTQERFKQQQEWVERELKARGIEPPKNAQVLSLVPSDSTPGPDAAG